MLGTKIKTVLGTMAIGDALPKQKAQQVLQHFLKCGHSEIDTAIMYQMGKTEKVLGELAIATNPSYQVATKANPWWKDGKSSTTQQAGLRPEVLMQQLDASLKQLKAPKVALFYLHAPDHQTPLIDTLRTVNELHQQDKFEEWGLSNYAAWQVMDIYHICSANGWKLPSVYQGMYNYVTRDVEGELFPAIRRCGMKFYAYNPLAGGVLTGAHKYEDEPTGGRFNAQTTWGQKYRDRFWHKSIFDSLDKIREIEKDVTLVDVAYRWLFFHSKLIEGDAVIIGGSSFEHIKANTDAIARVQPLPQGTLEEIDSAWNAAKPTCEKYYR